MVHRNRKAYCEREEGGEGVGEQGDYCTYRCTVITRMTSALRWAATRAILMFHNCEGQSHKTVSTDRNVGGGRRTEADSNRGPFGSRAHWVFVSREKIWASHQIYYHLNVLAPRGNIVYRPHSGDTDRHNYYKHLCLVLWEQNYVYPLHNIDTDRHNYCSTSVWCGENKNYVYPPHSSDTDRRNYCKHLVWWEQPVTAPLSTSATTWRSLRTNHAPPALFWAPVPRASEQVSRGVAAIPRQRHVAGRIVYRPAEQWHGTHDCDRVVPRVSGYVPSLSSRFCRCFRQSRGYCSEGCVWRVYFTFRSVVVLCKLWLSTYT